MEAPCVTKAADAAAGLALMTTPQERVRRAIEEEYAIVPYDPDWPRMFEEEKAHLLGCLLPHRVRRIEHFGSTAVPGLAAKPIVDILVEATDLSETRRRIVPILEEQGYEYFWRPTYGEDQPPFYAWFIKRNLAGMRSHHIHMVEAHHSEHWERLLFRDFLIAHPGVALQYQELKRALGTKYPADRRAYTQGKTAFIATVMVQAQQSSGVA